MPYAPQRDRDPHQLELRDTPWPVAPLNFFLTSGYMPGVYDLCWEDPAQQALNSRFQLLGVNVYRSFDSERGPFERITDLPVGATFWRDRTDNVLVLDEPVDDEQWLLRGQPSTGQDIDRFVFRTRCSPIVKPGSQAIPGDANDVVVRVDGELVPVLRAHGETGEVEIDVQSYANITEQKFLPKNRPVEGRRVTVSYRWNRSLLRTDLFQRVFYRLTTVALPVGVDPSCCRASQLLETPLERAIATSNYEIEKLDWIWREAVRRNRWILSQGGERVKVFIKKHVGTRCPCIQNDHHDQPINDCDICYGTSFIGGYEGPYDIVIAPDDAERRREHTNLGMRAVHEYEVWTGPQPLLSQQDFLVKVNGDRYSIGAVRMPTNRGMILQQHFNIGHIDERDIRFSVPMDSGFSLGRISNIVPPGHSPAGVTEHTLIPDERELRGRTVTWQNIIY